MAKTVDLNRVSKIYPSSDPIMFGKSKFTPGEIRLHPLTASFLNAPRLEELYLEKVTSENQTRSFRITLVFLTMYLLFVSPNLYNLSDADVKVRENSKKYCLYVFPPLVPIPILLWISKLDRFQRHFQNIYSLIVICWTFSFIGGGMHSMLNEWSVYIEDDINLLLNNTGLFDSMKVFTIEKNKDVWPFESLQGTSKEILFSFMKKILLPAATMNINLLRLVLVYVFVPLLRIDTLHCASVSLFTTISYNVLTMILYPSTNNLNFVLNKILVFCFPILFSIVMLLQNRDVERVVRQEFLHMWSIEREAEMANKQKDLFAEENLNLKKELAKQNESLIDLDSPIHKIIADLKQFQDDLQFTDVHRFRMTNILTALSKLDTNLFTPDINAQMRSQSGVDNDTKNWAMSVLGRKEYKQARFSNNSSPPSPETRSKSSVSMGLGENLIFPLENIPTIEDSTILSAIEDIDKSGWNFDTLKLGDISGGRPLYFIGLAIFEKHSMYDEMKVDRVALQNFLFTIDEGYLRNPYVSLFELKILMLSNFNIFLT